MAAPERPAGPDGDILLAEGLCTGYGKKQVLYDVGIRVGRGEAVAVLGHNGAGKTTLLKTLFGLLPPRGGRITFDAEQRTGQVPTAANVRRGMAMIPSERFVFADLSVIDNLRLGALTVRQPALRRERLEAAYAMFPVLEERATQAAGTLSGGQQRMLSLAMALMSGPRLLLLDEPSLGLAPALAQTVLAKVADLVQRDGMSAVLLEQNVAAALRLASRAYVLRGGRIVLEDTSESLLAMEREGWWQLL